MRLIDRIRALIAAGALAASASCMPQSPAESPNMLETSTTLLRALADQDGPGGLLDLALGFLNAGDFPACAAALQSHLLQFGDDPRVRAVLKLVESQLGG